MQNTKTFSLEIEKMAQEKSITHMDAVLEYCKSKEIEPESVTRLISKSLKDLIYQKAAERVEGLRPGAAAAMFDGGEVEDEVDTEPQEEE